MDAAVPINGGENERIEFGIKNHLDASAVPMWLP
jgi:hypothetical protein